MAVKQWQRRLPFDVANGKSRVGRPKAPRVIVVCSMCGDDIERYASGEAKRKHKRSFCSSCWNHFRRSVGVRPRAENTRIRELDRVHNGKRARTTHHGYIAVYEPAFAAARQSGDLPCGWQYEHRVVASKMLGRPLRRGEVVHHKNGIKTDNRPANLSVVTKSEHRRIHSQELADKLRRLAEYERRFGPLEATEMAAGAIDDDVSASWPIH